MKRNEKIMILYYYRNYLLYIKENCNEKPKQKEKQKVLVLKKNFYGRDLVVG